MEKKKVGRKSNYSTKVEPYFDRIRAWRQDGQTEENISKLLGISYRSFNEYKLKYEEFMQVLKESKDDLVNELERTLFQQALGKGTSKKYKRIYSKDMRTGQMILDKEEIQEDDNKPNPTLLIFSLKNLAPQKWQDRRITDTNVTADFEQLKTIAETLADIGKQGIDKSQFDEDDEDDE